MPGSNNLSSYLGNLTTSRQRLSAVRQRLKLEPDPKAAGGSMRPVAPSPPEGADMDKKSSAQAAVQEDEFDIDGWTPPDGMDDEMMTIIQESFKQNMPQPEAQPSNTPNPPAKTVPGGERVNAALAPLSEFFNKNGRIPDPEELKNMAASRALVDMLGREPTQQEVDLYRASPPKVAR